MGANRNDALDAAGIERLLSGHGSGPGRLADLLCAASAPGHPDELAGEEAAVTAFRLARRLIGVVADPVPTPRRHRRQATRASWTRLLTAKAGGVATVLVAGGVAFAAGTALLPGMLDDGATPAISAAGSGQPEGIADADTASGATGASWLSPSPGASASASLLGLCRAHLAHVARDPEMDKDPEFRHSTAFATLVAAAGGSDEVTSFCTAMVDPPPPSPTPDPAGTGERPSAPSTGRPTGPPTTQPASTPAQVQQELSIR